MFKIPGKQTTGVYLWPPELHICDITGLYSGRRSAVPHLLQENKGNVFQISPLELPSKCFTIY